MDFIKNCRSNDRSQRMRTRSLTPIPSVKNFLTKNLPISETNMIKIKQYILLKIQIVQTIFGNNKFKNLFKIH